MQPSEKILQETAKYEQSLRALVDRAEDIANYHMAEGNKVRALNALNKALLGVEEQIFDLPTFPKGKPFGPLTSPFNVYSAMSSFLSKLSSDVKNFSPSTENEEMFRQELFDEIYKFKTLFGLKVQLANRIENKMSEVQCTLKNK